MRGLHFQIENQKGKFVRVGCGELFDVAVEFVLTIPLTVVVLVLTYQGENKNQSWISLGLAHDSEVPSELADF
ncbi:dTDP-4-dehydrorhamnose 3,5-epimerase family protein [Dickeya zeae]|uniref:dTDP-4-dehydrorhamnose 3,5-epimerase family protein n=1 Tax=Dickeya zeae TaxID=204042 RepID=UPI003D7FD1CE